MKKNDIIFKMCCIERDHYLYGLSRSDKYFAHAIILV